MKLVIEVDDDYDFRVGAKVEVVGEVVGKLVEHTHYEDYGHDPCCQLGSYEVEGE
jgi:hypothetical protein